MADKTPSTLEHKRQQIRRKIRNQQVHSTLSLKRETLLKALEDKHGPLSKTVTIHSLYLKSQTKNALSLELKNGLLDSMTRSWKVGGVQVYFLLILANILGDDLEEEQLQEISATVRDHLDLDWKSNHFIEAMAEFLQSLFKSHSRTAGYQEEQVSNEETFLPVMRVILEQTGVVSAKEGVLKAIKHLLFDSDELQAHYKVKRNLRVVEMVVDFHYKLMEGSSETEPLQKRCLDVYTTAMDGFKLKRTFADTERFVAIMTRCLHKGQPKIMSRVVSVFQGIYAVPQCTYQHLDSFTRNQLLPVALQGQIQTWLLLVETLTRNSPDLLEDHLKSILSQIASTVRVERGMEVLNVCLDVLLEMSYIQREQAEYGFFEIFRSVQGFESLNCLGWVVSTDMTLFSKVEQLFSLEEEMSGKQRERNIGQLVHSMQAELT